MKKKLLATALIATMVLSMTACSGDASGSNEPKDSSVAVESTGTNEQSSNESQETVENNVAQSDEFTHEYVENYFGYSIDLLGAYNEELGAGYASYEPINGVLDKTQCEVIYITQYSGDVGDDLQKDLIDMTQYTDSTSIFDVLIKNIDIELFSASVYELKEYSVQTLETTEINGLEMTKFEGTIIADHIYSENDYTFPVVAYGIKATGTPVLLMCIDRTPDQSRHEVWVDKIDEMIATFQDGK